jgi:hypothetical protein
MTATSTGMQRASNRSSSGSDDGVVRQHEWLTVYGVPPDGVPARVAGSTEPRRRARERAAYLANGVINGTSR